MPAIDQNTSNAIDLAFVRALHDKGMPNPDAALLSLMSAINTVLTNTNRVTHGITGAIGVGEGIVALTANNLTVTLPLRAIGQVIVVKDEAGTAGTTADTVNAPAGGHIDGAASKTLNSNYGVLRLYCASADGKTWFTT